MTAQVFEAFTVPELAAHRAALGIETQAPSAPHGVVEDNDLCVSLRNATLRLFEQRGNPIARDTEMSFLRLGVYYGVFVYFPPVKGDVVVSGGTPLYVFTSVSDRGEIGIAKNGHRLRFVTDVLQF